MRMNFPLLAFAVYAASLFFYGFTLRGSRKSHGRIASALLAVGILTHFQWLLERSREVGSVPYADLYGAASLFSWFLALTYFGVERFHRQRAVAPVVLPFVLLSLAVSAWLVPDAPSQNPPARGPLFAVHVTSNILAYAGFALAFVMSGVFLVQNRVLRDRKPVTLIWQFPALEVLERMSRTSVLVGVVALICGMVLGAVWSNRLWGNYLSGDAKELVSFLILLLYAGYLILSRTTTWRGARASWLCVCNFAMVIFSFTVVNLYLSKYHRFL